MNKIKNHAKLLAEMVPPRSNPAGSRKLADNRVKSDDMQGYIQKEWPEVRPKVSTSQYSRWLHGDYKDAPPFLTHELYLKFKEDLDDDTTKRRQGGGNNAHVLED